MQIVNDQGFSAPQETQVFFTLNPDDDLADILPRLDHIKAIEIPFSSFADGRGFSLARQLRDRGYRGHLRATGPLIADQYAMARRAGFDDVAIPDEIAERQPEAQWRFRANWQAHDYQAHLRG